MSMGRIITLAILLSLALGASMGLGKTVLRKTVLAKTTGPVAARRAVVVELFTSEGCSSCPPADELLGHLRQDLSARNIQVIPLGFHVDYWNSLGWKDRFSSADFSARQEQYARSLKVDGPYTPQMVVDGETEFVGSSSGQANSAISHAASQPALATVKVSVSGDQLSVEVKATHADTGNVMLAITEDNLTTNVGSGENGGYTLHHTAVVRELRQLGLLHDGSFAATVPIKLAQDWKRENLHAVVFVQEGASGKIQGADSVALASQLR
ncbi:MAG TPA: DUF1223 domain-containing protein [Candidatus Angelobacter sp.]|jgi:hypothetical protein